MAHILSGCKVALMQGIHQWLHAKVWSKVKVVLAQREGRLDQMVEERELKFIRRREKYHETSSTQNSILDQGRGWDIKTDKKQEAGVSRSCKNNITTRNNVIVITTIKYV